MQLAGTKMDLWEPPSRLKVFGGVWVWVWVGTTFEDTMTRSLRLGGARGTVTYVSTSIPNALSSSYCSS